MMRGGRAAMTCFFDDRAARDDRADRGTIWLYRFATRRIEPAAHVGANIVLDVPGLSVSPDDRWLVYARQQESHSDLWIMGDINVHTER